MNPTRLVAAFTITLGLTLLLLPWPMYGPPHTLFETLAATFSTLFSLTITIVGVLIWVGAGDP